MNEGIFKDTKGKKSKNKFNYSNVVSNIVNNDVAVESTDMTESMNDEAEQQSLDIEYSDDSGNEAAVATRSTDKQKKSYLKKIARSFALLLMGMIVQFSFAFSSTSKAHFFSNPFNEVKSFCSLFIKFN